MSVSSCRSGSERARHGRMAGTRAKTRDGRRRGRRKIPVSPLTVTCQRACRCPGWWIVEIVWWKLVEDTSKFRKYVCLPQSRRWLVAVCDCYDSCHWPQVSSRGFALHPDWGLGPSAPDPVFHKITCLSHLLLGFRHCCVRKMVSTHMHSLSAR